MELISCFDDLIGFLVKILISSSFAFFLKKFFTIRSSRECKEIITNLPLETNISNANAQAIEDQKAVSTFELDVTDFKHLKSVIRSIEKVKGVIKVSRLNP